jgi:hypothetical protein
MRRDWEPEDLIACWTLIDDDWAAVANKSAATRLGFALLLKFFELEARFPRHAGELPPAAVEYVADQVRVPATAFVDYEWSGRTIEYHRAQIRSVHGFREATRDDEEQFTAWLAAEVCAVELSEDRLRAALLARCRAARVEPPGRIERILGHAAQAPPMVQPGHEEGIQVCVHNVGEPIGLFDELRTGGDGGADEPQRHGVELAEPGVPLAQQIERRTAEDGRLS